MKTSSFGVKVAGYMIVPGYITARHLQSLKREILASMKTEAKGISLIVPHHTTTSLLLRNLGFPPTAFSGLDRVATSQASQGTTRLPVASVAWPCRIVY